MEFLKRYCCSNTRAVLKGSKGARQYDAEVLQSFGYIGSMVGL